MGVAGSSFPSQAVPRTNVRALTGYQLAVQAAKMEACVCCGAVSQQQQWQRHLQVRSVLELVNLTLGVLASCPRSPNRILGAGRLTLTSQGGAQYYGLCDNPCRPGKGLQYLRLCTSSRRLHSSSFLYEESPSSSQALSYYTTVQAPDHDATR